MTFGDAVESMKEHHAQVIDRTKAERVTYEVAKEAERYLQERRQRTHDKICSDDHDELPQLRLGSATKAIFMAFLTWVSGSILSSKNNSIHTKAAPVLTSCMLHST